MKTWELGDNVEASLEGEVLTLKIDLKKRFGASASGKSVKVASTGGNKVVPVEGTEYKVGLNVFLPAG
jgi:hypothetical protein